MPLWYITLTHTHLLNETLPDGPPLVTGWAVTNNLWAVTNNLWTLLIYNNVCAQVGHNASNKGLTITSA